MFAIFSIAFFYCPIVLFGIENIIAQKQIRAKLSEGAFPDDNISDYDWSVWCKFQPNGFDCTEKEPVQPKFYYDIKMEDCKTFTFGLCGKSKNHFETRTECHERCADVGLRQARANVSEKIYCRYQPDFGQCNNYYPMYYFDITYRACRGFSYSGCGGNLNRFHNAQICAAICSGSVEY